MSKIVVLAIIVVILIIIVVLAFLPKRKSKSRSSSTSVSSDSRTMLSPVKYDPKRKIVGTGGLTTFDVTDVIEDRNSKYSIVVDPELQVMRDKIFTMHIDDVVIPLDIRTDPNYPKIIQAIKSYHRAPTMQELEFLVRYKKFLDMDGVYSMCGPKEIDQLYLVMLNVISNKIEGDCVETGTWHGGMGMYAKAILNHFNHATTKSSIKDVHDRRVWLFDAFDSFPAPVKTELSDGTVLQPHTNDLSVHALTQMMYDKPVNVVQVRDSFAKLGLLDDKVRLVKGLFTQTIPAALSSNSVSGQSNENTIDKISVLRVDNDYYDSVYYVLDSLYDKVSPGGYVICDDYNNVVLGCKDAVTEFRSKRGITSPIVDTYGGSVYWQV